ncbi:DUF2573 family protein [Neobacillus muris]|uniref:DUF2573 family protein n=1 Tax=Neobacillus muris TaxID=2941334 RepID=UPI0020401E3F|nr:DUF2573 family protein [Neobacillus muris]
MKNEFDEQFETLLEKYSELLVGETDEETVKKVKTWALYTHIGKTMPALISHWSALYPEARAGMKQLIQEIKVLNEQHRSSKKE